MAAVAEAADAVVGLLRFPAAFPNVTVANGVPPSAGGSRSSAKRATCSLPAL
jgi:hypothetical protein